MQCLHKKGPLVSSKIQGFFQKPHRQKKAVTKNRQNQNDQEQNISIQYEGSSLIAIIFILFYSHS